MQRIMLRSKIYRATVTQCDLNYEGPCGIDQNSFEPKIVFVDDQNRITGLKK